jgi:hypothetical protein
MMTNMTQVTEFIKWKIYHVLNWISITMNIVCKMFAYDLQSDLGLNWLVWLESRRVEREIRARETQKLNKQKEAEEKMRLAKEDLEDGQNISQQQ